VVEFLPLRWRIVVTGTASPPCWSRYSGEVELSGMAMWPTRPDRRDEAPGMTPCSPSPPSVRRCAGAEGTTRFQDSANEAKLVQPFADTAAHRAGEYDRRNEGLGLEPRRRPRIGCRWSAVDSQESVITVGQDGEEVAGSIMRSRRSSNTNLHWPCSLQSRSSVGNRQHPSRCRPFSGISLMKAVSTLLNGSTNNVDYPYQLGLLATSGRCSGVAQSGSCSVPRLQTAHAPEICAPFCSRARELLVRAGRAPFPAPRRCSCARNVRSLALVRPKLLMRR
jgi:hypothetical protein